MGNPQHKRIEVFSDAVVRTQIASDDKPIRPIAKCWLSRIQAKHSADLHLRVVRATGAWFGIAFHLELLASRMAQHAPGSWHCAASNLSLQGPRAIIAPVRREFALFRAGGDATRVSVAVARTLEELRMNEVDVESLARLARGGEDLAAIARVVDQELTNSRLSDRAARFRAAIDSITSSGNSGYVGLPLLLFDVAVRSRW